MLNDQTMRLTAFQPRLVRTACVIGYYRMDVALPVYNCGYKRGINDIRVHVEHYIMAPT